jgi:hypothetical protein
MYDGRALCLGLITVAPALLQSLPPLFLRSERLRLWRVRRRRLRRPAGLPLALRFTTPARRVQLPHLLELAVLPLPKEGSPTGNAARFAAEAAVGVRGRDGSGRGRGDGEPGQWAEHAE